MPITALKPTDVQAIESILRGQSCAIDELLNLRIEQTHPEAVDARYTHAIKAILTKPTLGHSPHGESDELILTLTLKSNPTPRQTIERYVADEFPGWTMRDWWTTKDVLDDSKPF